MGKKHKHPEHENLERWLVSYADFITLLFATFVVLYALSQADLAKFKEFSVSVKAAFNPAKSVMENPGGVMKGTPDAGILKDSGNSILDKVLPQDPGNGPGEGGGAKTLREAIQDVNQEIAKINQQHQKNGEEVISQPEVKLQERGVVISLASSLFFESGSAGLKPEAFKVLDTLADTLKRLDNVIHVEGHTDSSPIFTAIYPSNWELSSARASSVIRYFIRKEHFAPERLAAVGYADTRPIAPNTSTEGRQKNRRVDLVILNSAIVQHADAGAAQEDEEKIPIYMSDESEGGLGYSPPTAPETKNAHGDIGPKPIEPIVPLKSGGHDTHAPAPTSHASHGVSHSKAPSTHGGHGASHTPTPAKHSGH